MVGPNIIIIVNMHKRTSEIKDTSVMRLVWLECTCTCTQYCITMHLAYCTVIHDHCTVHYVGHAYIESATLSDYHSVVGHAPCILHSNTFLRPSWPHSHAHIKKHAIPVKVCSKFFITDHVTLL